MGGQEDRAVLQLGPDEVVMKEGLVTLVVPKDGVGGKKGPSHSSPVFFNPAMELARDIAVSLFPTLQERFRRRVLDGLAGTGVRGLRIAKECEGHWGEITINDKHPWAHASIVRNMALNGVDPEKVRATKRHVGSLLLEESFTYIEIDPYGNIIPFIDAAIQSSTRSVIAITATDTSALTGSSADACLRRYGARARPCYFQREAGLRILIGAVARHAARFDKTVTPLVSHASDYYMRTCLMVWDGARRADDGLLTLGYTTIHEDGRVETVSAKDGAEHIPKNKVNIWGPLWTGPLHDANILEKMRVPAHSRNGKALKRLFEDMIGEVGLMPMFYDLDELSKRVKPNAPRLERLLVALRDAGFKASRTQFSPKGFKTDMPYDELVELWKRM